MTDKSKIIMAVQDYLTRPKKKPKHKQQRRVAAAKQGTLFQETKLCLQK